MILILSVSFYKSTYVPTRIGLTCGMCYITNGVELCEPTNFCQRFNSNQKFNYIEEKCSLKWWGFVLYILSLYLAGVRDTVFLIQYCFPKYVATIISSAIWTMA